MGGCGATWLLPPVRSGTPTTRLYTTSRFGRYARRPGTNEIQSNVLVTGKYGNIQLSRIGLSHCCEHVFVFKSVTCKCLHLCIDDPIQASRRKNCVLRRTCPGILRAGARRKRESGNCHKSSFGLWITS